MEKALRKKSIPIFLIIAAILVTAVAFFACGKKTSASVDFVQDGQVTSELILSKDQPENLADYIKTKNVKQSQITFEVSDKSIYTIENGLYTFTESAHTLVFAKLQKEVLASAELVIKAKFPAPSSVTIDENGILHWNESVTIENGQDVSAQSYTVTINGQKQPSVSETSFNLQQYATENGGGDFSIYVQADGLKYVDASERQSQPFSFYLPKLDEVSLTDFKAEANSVSLQWNPVEHASYNIYLDGINIARNLTLTSHTIDFSMTEGGQQVEVKIEAAAKGYISSQNTITIKKLETPVVTYSKESGSISWDASDNKTYVLTHTNLSTKYSDSLMLNDSVTTLDSLQRGIYRLSVMAQGSQSVESENGIYYANSNISQEQIVAKLQIETPTYSIDGTTLSIQLSEDDYIENYTLYYGDRIQDWNVKSQGYTMNVDISNLEVGQQNLRLVAKPTLEGENVKAYPKNDVDVQDEVTQVLSSKQVPLTVFVLGAFGDVEHALNGSDSTLTFGSVQDATNYKVTVNGANEKTFAAQDGETQVLNIGDLATIDPIGDRYQIQIEAYREDGHSLNSHLSQPKTLTILAKAERSDSQTNGYFAWKQVENASYYYEIYSVDKGFEVDGGVLSGAIKTGEGEIFDGVVRNNEKLDVGYYVIRVYVRSNDDNKEHLAADFKDKTRFLVEKFYVYQQIASPVVTYDIASNTLTINSVEFASEYKISVNEREIEIPVKNENSDAGKQLTYKFSNDFDNEGTYAVRVVAMAGEKNDSTLHTDSVAGQITIIRLPQPSLGNGDIELVDENLTLILSKPEYCKEVKLSIDGKAEALDETLRVDVSKYTQFLAKIEYVAQDSGDGIYYLGNENSIDVKRVSTPTNLEFSDGQVTYACENHAYVDHYIIKVQVNCVGDVTYRLDDQQTKELKFNLQQLLDTQKQVDLSQMESISVWVVAYQSQTLNVGGDKVFYIPSFYAQTAAGQKKLDLERLKAPTISYTPSKRELSWSNVGEIGQTKYAVYVDGELKEENLVLTTYSEWLESYFLTAKSVCVKASNPHYLDSATSNEIWIKKLVAVQKLNVFQDDEGNYKASISSSEAGRVKDVVIGTEPAVSLSPEGTLVFEIEKYIKDGVLEIKFEAVENVGNYYYEDSDKAIFNLVNLSSKNLTLTIADGEIRWNNVTGDDFEYITYTIVISDSHDFKKELPTKDTKFALDKKDFVSVTTGEYDVKVVAVVDDYALEAGQGYFGKCESTNSKLSKLSPVGDITITVKDGEIEGATRTQNKVEFTAQLEFADIWHSDVEFEVTVNAGQATTYKVSPNLEKYRIDIAHTHFQEGQNIVHIVVKSKTAITSNETTMSVMRYPQVGGLEISKDGIVSFEGDCKNYLIMLTFDNENYIYKEITGKSEDLMESFGNNVGAYTIEVVGYDATGAILPSIKVAKFNGIRLAGISNVVINDSGEVEINLQDKVDIDSGVIFEAQYNGKSLKFSPRQKDGTSTFVYTMIEFVRDFNIQVAGQITLSLNVRKENNVSAHEVDCTFEYKAENDQSLFARGRNYADDYFKFSYLNSTSAFNVLIQLFEDETFAEAVETENVILRASDYLGYWIETTDDNGNPLKYFAKTVPSDLKHDDTSTQCYAIPLHELLKDKKQLFYQVSFSRIEKGEIMTQYSEVTLPIEKLAAPGTLMLTNGVLNWLQSESEKTQSYYIYFQDVQNKEVVYLKQTTASNFNLNLDEGLAPGSSHYLSVVAISKSTMSDGRYLIASDSVTNEINSPVYKQKIPTRVVVENGKLIFDPTLVEGSDFLNAIKDNYNLSGEDFLKLFVESTFSEPFTLTPRDFANATIKLRFESSNGTFTPSVRAIDLLPSLSRFTFNPGDGPITYLQAFNNKYDSVTNENNEFKINIRAFHDIIQTVDGIADDEMPFDQFGFIVPAGLYNLKAQQAGFDAMWWLESDYSQNATALSVTRAPAITLDKKDENSQTHYLLKFKPSVLYTSTTASTLATQYKLILKNENYTYLFTLINSDGRYNITNVKRSSGASIKEFSAVNFSLEIENENVVIDITELLAFFNAKQFQDGGDDVRFIKTGNYEFTIYASGNNYSTNSKNEYVDVNFLGINAGDIHLENGELYWTCDQQFENLSTVVRYKRNDMHDEAELPQTIQFENGMAKLKLPAGFEGYYQYIVLYIKGGLGRATINIDSDRYVLNDVFKMPSPTILTAGNKFTLPYGAPQDSSFEAKYYTNSYVITDNIGSEAVKFSSAESGRNEYWPNTEGASEYYITRLGNTSEFKVVSSDDAGYYILQYVGSTTKVCTLSAEPTKIKAKMLKAVDELTTNAQGNVQWKGIENENDQIEWAGGQYRYQPFELNDTLAIVYKVSVYANQALQSSYFTTNTTFDTINLTSLSLRISDEISFRVRALILSKTQLTDTITTLEGERFGQTEVEINAEGSGVLVLAGKDFELSEVNGEKIYQAPSPTGVTTKDGQLVWTLESADYESEVVDSQGQIYHVENSGKADVEFTPSLEYYQNPYTLRVYTYGGENNLNLIKSRAITASNNSDTSVYKLPNIDDDDYTITQGSSKITINFDKLLQEKRIKNSNSYYLIKLTISLKDGSQLVLQSRDKAVSAHRQFVLNCVDSASRVISINECDIRLSDVKKLTYQVVDAQITQEIMTINGEEYEVDNAVFEGKVSAQWNDDSYRFDFTSDDQTDIVYEVSLRYQDGGTEQDEVSTKYYQPKKLGTITAISLRVRRPNGFYTDMETQRGQWQYTLFRAGLGTRENPYQISNADQFSNMKYRNQTNCYFVLTNSITLVTQNGYAFEQDFIANLNGAGFTINATISPSTLSEKITENLPITENETYSLTFNSRGSLFKQIGLSGATGLNGVVENLKLSLTFNYLAQADGQMMSGLTVQNYGTIQNVQIISISTNATRELTTAMQVGLVLYNYSTISDCENLASFEVSAYSANMALAGLVYKNNITNGTVTMTRCFNRGDIVLSLQQGNNNRLWTSGVAIKNTATITQSGNDGKIDIKGNNIVRAIISGVCVDSNGIMQYCFNNGALTAPSASNSAVGAISYMLSGGSVSYLVDTTSTRIALICKNYVIKDGKLYTNCETPTTNLQTEKLPNSLNKSCGGGHSLVLENGKAKII